MKDRSRSLVSPDGVAPSRIVGVSTSVNLPLHHKVQKFFSGTGSPGWSRKKGRKTVVVVLWRFKVTQGQRSWCQSIACHGWYPIQLHLNHHRICHCFLHSNLTWRALTTTRNKSSALAEMGDRGYNRHGPKRGGGAAVPLLWGSWVPV